MDQLQQLASVFFVELWVDGSMEALLVLRMGNQMATTKVSVLLLALASACYTGADCEPNPGARVRVLEVYQTDSCGAYEQHVRDFTMDLSTLLTRNGAVLNGCELKMNALSSTPGGDETYKVCSFRFTVEDGPVIAKGECTYEIRQQGGICKAPVDVVVYSLED